MSKNIYKPIRIQCGVSPKPMDGPKMKPTMNRDFHHLTENNYHFQRQETDYNYPDTTTPQEKPQ